MPKSEIKRKIEERIESFLINKEKSALLITGARQVGKTHAIRKCLDKYTDSYVELNMYEDPDAAAVFADYKNTADILLRLSALAGDRMIPGRTVIFLDEIQAAADIATAIKFLVEEGSYRYILSGSLLGVELKSIRSVPVGYMSVQTMYPIDFEEFCTALGTSREVLDNVHSCYEERIAVDKLIHERLMDLFRLYMIVGGMPAVVSSFLDSNNIKYVTEEQLNIINLYKWDISKYDPDHKLYIGEIFDLIPRELNDQNKRFILKRLNENLKFSRYENSFLWLKDAGTALPAFCVDEPQVPLLASKSRNLFKLFMCDIGLLMRMYGTTLPAKVLAGSLNMNYGALYENIAAQELTAHGYDLYYYNSHKNGELDFLIERDDVVIPIEVKSGKDYRRHNALTNVMNNPRYDIKEGVVLCNDNVSTEGKVSYLPAYMLMYIIKEQAMEDCIYKPNMEGIN